MDNKNEFVITNFYRSNLQRDMSAYNKMMKKVEALKIQLGDKYLLAKHVEKKHAGK